MTSLVFMYVFAITNHENTIDVCYHELKGVEVYNCFVEYVAKCFPARTREKMQEVILKSNPNATFLKTMMQPVTSDKGNSLICLGIFFFRPPPVWVGHRG